MFSDTQGTSHFIDDHKAQYPKLKWDMIAVVPEFGAIQRSLASFNPEVIPIENPLYFQSADGVKCFFMAEMEKHSRYAVGFLQNIQQTTQI
jgi:hypothetical protein